MNELGKHVYGPWALVTGAPSGIGDEFARQAATTGTSTSHTTSEPLAEVL